MPQWLRSSMLDKQPGLLMTAQDTEVVCSPVASKTVVTLNKDELLCASTGPVFLTLRVD